jgi:hypothetical protein
MASVAAHHLSISSSVNPPLYFPAPIFPAIFAAALFALVSAPIPVPATHMKRLQGLYLQAFRTSLGHGLIKIRLAHNQNIPLPAQPRYRIGIHNDFSDYYPGKDD